MRELFHDAENPLYIIHTLIIIKTCMQIKSKKE